MLFMAGRWQHKLTNTHKLCDEEHQPHNEEAALQAHCVEHQQAEGKTRDSCQHDFLQGFEDQVGYCPVQAITLLPDKDRPL